MPVKEKITTLLEALNQGVYEREQELKLALLSSIAGESIFLLGPPGVAKSLVARKLKFAYKDADVFEYLMSRFSTPDEIFGPVSIKKLKEEDKYERVVEKYLPSADVVFLDEIWKAGPSIQNALLTVINEKIYRNGDAEIKVPMKALISASNELPAKDQGLEALWDRFLIRLIVQGIKDKDIFNKMISEKLNAYEDTVNEKYKITEAEYEQWGGKIDEITIPENVFNVIDRIRNYINEYNEKEDNQEKQIYISDRRWRKIVRLLRASAFLNDRKEVDLMDCFLMTYCLWNEEEQIATVYGFVEDAIKKYGYTVSLDFKGIKEELKKFQEEINEETKFIKDTKKQNLVLVHNDYYEIVNPPGNYEKLIKKSDFYNLSNQDQNINLYYWDASWNQVKTAPRSYYGNRNSARIGSSKFNVVINHVEYTLKQTATDEKRQATRKPHPSVEKDWDGRVSVYLQDTDKMKAQIEEYRNKDLKFLRVNTFVSPELANVVESHIIDVLKSVEKIEVEIKEIQNKYKKLKDEEIVS